MCFRFILQHALNVKFSLFSLLMSYWNALSHTSDFGLSFWSWVACFDVCLDFLTWSDISILSAKLSFWKGNPCLRPLILCKWEEATMRLAQEPTKQQQLDNRESIDQRIIRNTAKKYNTCLHYYLNIACFRWFWSSHTIFRANSLDWSLSWITAPIPNLTSKTRAFGCSATFLEIMEPEKIYINIL